MTLAQTESPPARDVRPDGPPAAARGRRLRVLVGAYAVSPARGSEPGTGWGMCRALADLHDVTVLCATGAPGPEHSIFRDEVEAHLAARGGPIPGLTLHYVPRPPLSRWVQKEKELYRRTLYYAGYKAWQKAALAEARRLHAARPFDVVHQLNMTGFREPGYLWRLDAPFVWGPIGGGANIPAAYFPLMGWVDRAFYAVRNVSNEVQKRLARRPRQAARRAGQLWTIGHQTQDMVGRLWGLRSDPMLETGIDPRPDAVVRRRDPAGPLKVVWSGLHIGRKALPLLLHAVKALADDAGGAAGAGVDVTVLGGGPLTGDWQRLSVSLGLADRVRFAGKLPHADALAAVRGADVLAFTSVQEGTPNAVLEALALGVPVVCHDACGMGVAVTPECGIKVPMTGVPASVAGFAAALRRLRDEPDLLGRLSAGAVRRTADLVWPTKAAEVDAAYRRVVGSRQ
ncbi:MAG: hypothetical protein JWO31_1164 [Phycisphaerales bacterium]|nr:hypothetical protein [Phycisphaerales bacterium]